MMTGKVTVLQRLRELARSPEQRRAADQAFLDKAVVLDFAGHPLLLGQTLEQLVARRAELGKSVEEFAAAVGQLPKPCDRRLRIVHNILHRGIDRLREIVKGVDALANGDKRAIKGIDRALRRWKASTDRGQLLLRDYALEKLALAGKGIDD